MISIVFGLGTAICFAASSLVASRAVKQIDSWSVVAWTMLVGLVITLPFVIASGIPTAASGANIGWLLATGVGNVSGLVLAAFAYRVGKVGVITPILATEGALAAVIASILGESIAPLVAFLLLLIVGGVVLAAIAPDPAPLDHERPVVAVLLATGGAVVFGISLYAAGRLSGDLPISWVLLPARLVGVLALTIPLALTRRLNLTRRTAPLVAGMGVLEVVGFTSFAIGAQYQVAITSVLASQFAPIAAIMAFLLFKERLGRLQITGVAIIVVGVAALTLAS
ncbi:MAG: DMT family transporter [Actinobacteria bacterium]|nr:DMT family transporter [Actinomycetota bacterium]